MPAARLSLALGAALALGIAAQAIAADGAPPPVTSDVVLDYDSPPRPLRLTRPVYPPLAFAQKREGTVTLALVIDAKGRVRSARVATSSPPFDDAALECAVQWRFTPARKGGRPVTTTALAPIVFRIY